MPLYCFLFCQGRASLGVQQRKLFPVVSCLAHARCSFPRADQIVSVRTWLNESCGIPESDMVGMRNPFLITNPGIRKVGWWQWLVALHFTCWNWLPPVPRLLPHVIWAPQHPAD